MKWKSLSIVLNLVGLFVFMATLAVVYLWPQHLGRLGLDMATSRMLMMQEISFLLLLGAFQQNLPLAWQRASLAGSFIVLAECTLMALL